MTVINTNVGALQARTYAVRADSNVTKAMERLSSGLRINSAADDAAGLAVANKMESQIRGMNMAIRNSQDGISLVQTAEAAMGEINNMVIRMRELAVQMNNGVYTDTDRANAQLEVTALLAEIDKVATNSAFNQVKILDGTYSQDIRAGNTNPEVINVTIDRMNTDSLGGGRVTAGVEEATNDSVNTSARASHYETSISASEGRPAIATSLLGMSELGSNGSFSIVDGGSSDDSGRFEVVNGEITLKSDSATLATYASEGGNTELKYVDLNPNASPPVTGNSVADNNTYTFTVSYQDGSVTATEEVTLKITDKQPVTVQSSNGQSVLTVEESACVKVAAGSVLSNEVNEFIGAANDAGRTLSYSLVDRLGDDVSNNTININQTTGEITASLDFERPVGGTTNDSNTYGFNVRISDGVNTLTEEVTLNVTDYDVANSSDEDDANWDSTSAFRDVTAGTAAITLDNDGTTDASIDLNTTLTALGDFIAAHDDGGDGWSIVSIDGAAPSDSVTIDTGVTLTAGGTVAIDASAASNSGTINDVLLRYTADDGMSVDVNVDVTFGNGSTGISQTSAGTIDVFANAANVDLALSTGGSAALDTDVLVSAQSNLLTAFIGDHSAAATGSFDVISIDGVDVTEISTGSYDIGLGVSLDTDTGSLAVDQDHTDAAAGSIDDVHIRYTAADGRVFDLFTDISMTDVANTATDNSSAVTASGELANGADETIAVQAGGEAAVLDLTDGTDGKFESMATFYAANPCGLFEVNNVRRNDVPVGGTDYANSLTVNNSGELILEEGVEAGTYTAEIYYTDNEGDSFTQRVDITVSEAGIRGENVAGRPASADQTATALSHSPSTVIAENVSSESVSGVSVIEINEARQGTIKSVSSTAADRVLSEGFSDFALTNHAGGTFELGDVTGGSDAELFTIDAETGDIATKGLVDYESKTSYEFNVTYTKGSNTFTERVTLSVKDDTVDNTTHISDVSLGTQAGAAEAVTILDTAINQISSSQAKLGAIQNRLQYNIDNLSKASMLTQTAKGRIMDADFASETSELSKQQILSQAATSMLAQANQSKQSVLALLQ